MDLHKQFPNISYEVERYALTQGVEFGSLGLSSVDLLLDTFSANEPCMREARGSKRTATTESVGIKFANDVRELLRRSQVDSALLEKASSGLTEIDKKLEGGFQIGTISEVFGVSGSGKSHFVGQCMLEMLNENGHETPGSECLIICTEAPLETRRLIEMSDTDPSGNLQRISQIYCPDFDLFDHVVSTQLPAFLDLARSKGRTIRMVIIDSIGHQMRGDVFSKNSTAKLRKVLRYQERELRSNVESSRRGLSFDVVKTKYYRVSDSFRAHVNRANFLMNLHLELTRLSRTYNLAIVLTNQVSDYFDLNTDVSRLNSKSPTLEYSQQIGVFSGWSPQLLLRQKTNRILGTFPDNVSLESQNRALHIEEPSGECRDEDSPSIACLGNLWSRLATSRVRMSRCVRTAGDGAPSSRPLILRTLSLDMASNLVEEKPVTLKLTAKGLEINESPDASRSPKY